MQPVFGMVIAIGVVNEIPKVQTRCRNYGDLSLKYAVNMVV